MWLELTAMNNPLFETPLIQTSSSCFAVHTWILLLNALEFGDTLRSRYGVDSISNKRTTSKGKTLPNSNFEVSR